MGFALPSGALIFAGTMVQIYLFSKYGVSMKRHALEGICIPLEDMTL